MECNCVICQKRHLFQNESIKIKTTSLVIMILESLQYLNPQTEFFSLINDILPFIETHMDILKHLKIFKTGKWRKAILDSMNHSSHIQSGKDACKTRGFYKLLPKNKSSVPKERKHRKKRTENATNNSNPTSNANENIEPEELDNEFYQNNNFEEQLKSFDRKIDEKLEKIKISQQENNSTTQMKEKDEIQIEQIQQSFYNQSFQQQPNSYFQQFSFPQTNHFNNLNNVNNLNQMNQIQQIPQIQSAPQMNHMNQFLQSSQTGETPQQSFQYQPYVPQQMYINPFKAQNNQYYLTLEAEIIKSQSLLDKLQSLPNNQHLFHFISQSQTINTNMLTSSQLLKYYLSYLP